MDEQKKPQVGETLYSLNIGNAARRVEQTLTPMTVLTVGRKYFTVAERDHPHRKPVKFDLKTWRQVTEYSADHRLYRDPQEWVDETARATACARLYEAFEARQNRENLPLSTLAHLVEVVEGRQPAAADADALKLLAEAQGHISGESDMSDADRAAWMREVDVLLSDATGADRA